jgi:cytochrome b6-f complex iron-sulfur subunit
MSEKEDKNSSQPAPSRRRFLSKIWIALGGLAFFEMLGVVFAYLRPRKLPARSGDFGSRIVAGAVDGFEPNSVTAFPRGHFYLVRLDDGGFLALSRKCTHLGCTVPWNADEKKFICPCHSSAFDVRGDVIRPPAPRALDRFAVNIENGRVRVDTAKAYKRTGFHIEQVTYPKKQA